MSDAIASRSTRITGDSLPTADSKSLLVSRALAAVLALTLPIAMLGVPIALALLPVWLLTARRFRHARLLQFLIIGSALSGVVLYLLRPAGGDFSLSIAREVLQLLATSLVVFSSMLWVRATLGIPAGAAFYALGALAFALVDNGGNLDPDTWKAEYAWPLVILMLSLAAMNGRRSATVAAIFGSMAVAVIAEYRSLAAIMLLAGVLAVLSPMLRTRAAGRKFENARLVAALVLICGSVYAVYAIIERLLISGFFGQAIQIKTISQIDSAGSLIAGGRVEGPIALRLLARNPWGFGPGYVPTVSDYSQGVDSLQTQADWGYYLTGYVFNDRLKLHSTWGDLWSNLGPLGLVLAVVVATTLVAALWRGVRARATPVLLFVLCIWGLWDTAFSPIYSNLHNLVVALALVVAPVTAESVRARAGSRRSIIPEGSTFR